MGESTLVTVRDISGSRRYLMHFVAQSEVHCLAEMMMRRAVDNCTGLEESPDVPCGKHHVGTGLGRQVVNVVVSPLQGKPLVSHLAFG